MTISIALCTYNGAVYLSTQLESFARQTVLPDEIVICDDGSTDETLQIAEKFSQTAPFKLRIFQNEQNLGYTKNFERAIMLCKGDLIALSDQDDLWYPHKLAVLSSFFLENNSVGGVFSDGDLMDAALSPTGRTLWQNLRFTRKEQNRFRSGMGADVLFQRNVVTGMTMMFRSDLRDKLLPIPRSWPHDGWLAFMLILHSNLSICPGCLVGYRTHQNQQTGPPLSRAQKLRSVGRNGISASLNRSRSNNLVEYEKTALQFDDLTSYLQSDKVQIENSLLAHAAAKASHARTAIATLSSPRPHRFKEVLSHAADYQRYSSPGLQNMLRDLII
jgi:glycosyltransferase involved in cell wall biosynthesis